MARALLRHGLAALLLAVVATAAARPASAMLAEWSPPSSVEVIVGLAPPPAAQAGWRAERPRAARAAVRAIDRSQLLVGRRILARVPGASITWQYHIVLDGLAVSLPPSRISDLTSIPGVERVYPTVTYHALADDGPAQIGAPAVWGADLAHQGAGIRIGIIDDGIDPTHPYFAPDGLTPPPGFPKGDTRFTSGKVIVARAFAPPDTHWRYARVPFDPVYSFHGLHVAGIAAGDAGTVAPATQDRPTIRLSGVAPRAYLGNYKALTVPTASGVGLDGNSPELVAAIEAAVADGMNVINLSLGEPEITPSQDAVALALDNAARAGVVPVVAAGNDFEELGQGTVSSPGSSALAITVGAVTGARYFGTAAHLAGLTPVPADLQTFGGVSSPAGIPEALTHDTSFVDAASLGDADLCSPLPADALTQAVVLTGAGRCSFEQKTRRARAAGALALVVTLARSGDPDYLPPGDLPGLEVASSVGDELASYLATAGATARVRFDVGPAEVASVEGGRVAPFSSAGPTPLSLRLKPDVAAPGVGILSAQPSGTFDLLAGTSMAAPHVAGAAALLRELHPEWTVEEIKAALVLTGEPVWANAARSREVPVTREGGGLVDLPAAANPLVLATPAELSFGLVDAPSGGAEQAADVTLDDAGGGAGTWSVHVEQIEAGPGASIEAPNTVEVPGTLNVRLEVGSAAAEGERDGFIVLERNGVERRIPYWLRVTRPRLPADAERRLPGPGVYRGDASLGESHVDDYRYPSGPPGPSDRLAGPEQVFKIVLDRPAANLGVAVVSEGHHVDVEPRIVAGQDENRLLGPLALPFVANPYLTSFESSRPVAGVRAPQAGPYWIVFDTRSRRRAGPFTFRVWVGDTTPPQVRLLSRVATGGLIRARAVDAGAGVDPAEITFRLDNGFTRRAQLLAGGLLHLDVSDVRPGRHVLVLRVSDRQESKNDENVAGVLPNTRTVRAVIRVPREPGGVWKGAYRRR